MTTYLVTGCAGFIGTTFVHYMLNRYTDIKIINLDALTYAGNLENLKDLEDDERHIFVHGNICDKEGKESAQMPLKSSCSFRIRFIARGFGWRECPDGDGKDTRVPEKTDTEE